MGKKFVPLSVQNSKIRLYLDDIQKVHKIKQRKLPTLPDYKSECFSNQETASNEIDI